MADDLGARLLKAGLVTGPQLARCLFDGGKTVERGAWLACALTDGALPEDALVGYFVFAGHPRWVHPEELAARPDGVAALVPPELARSLLAVPVREDDEGLVVAMIDPSDHDAVATLREVTGTVVVPRPARVSDVRRALERLARAEVASEPASEPAPASAPEPATASTREAPLASALATAPASAPEPPSEPAEVVLELRRRRDSGPSDAWRSTTPTHEAAPPPVRAPEVAPQLDEMPTEFVGRSTLEFGPMPLERPKPTVAAPRAGLDDWSDLSSPGTLAAPAPSPPRPAPATRASVARETSAPPRRTPSTRAAARLADIGIHLAVMRTSWDRDEVVRHACEAARTVADAVVFLALTKGVLKGWHGAGAHLTPEMIRGLWLPTGSASMFRDVTSRGDSYRGPYGTTAADNLFRAALGTRNSEVALLPVHVSGRCVAVLAADGLKHGDAGMERLAVVAHAAGEAFRRIVASRRP